MIYIYKNEPNFVVTDSLGDILLDSFQVFIDDLLIGEFINESCDQNYIAFTLEPGQLINLNNAEAHLRIIYYDKLVKSELISILDLDNVKPTKIKTKTNSIKYYEK